MIYAVMLMFPASVVSQNGSTLRGTVKLGDTVLPGVIVIAVSTNSHQRKGSQTNSAGEYEFKQLPTGDYLITLGNTPYVLVDGIGGAFQSVEVKDTGLTVLNLAVTEGGVVTGCAEYPSKQPVIGREVLCEGIDSSSQGFSSMHFRSRVVTDDRGCFRVFGLPAGQYRVGIGNARELATNLPLPFSPTYYPGVRSRSEAGTIKLTAAQEYNLGTLVLKDELNTFLVKGVFNNGYTDQKLPNYIFELIRYDENRISSTTQLTADERGQFRLEDLLEGHYSIQPAVKQKGNVEYTFSPVSFEVTDKDITELVIYCTSLTASIKGEVLINNIQLAGALDCTIALKEGDGLDVNNGRIHRVILDRGKFSVSGLTRGVYTLVVMPLRPSLQYQEAQVGRESIVNGGAYGILRIDLTAGEEAVRIFLKGR
jgi:uncharacterized surface anchored protein